MARLVAANLKRIRQERGLGFAELARRLAAAGHPVADTALMKTEKGERRASVDDVAALAVVLGTTPNRLMLPGMDTEPPDDDEPAPWGKEPPSAVWAWATGEVPLGRPPASSATERRARGAEITFSRENRQHLWNAAPAPAPPSPEVAAAQAYALAGLGGFVAASLAAGLATADVRAAVEGALITALVSPPTSSAGPLIEVTGDRVTVWMSSPDSPGRQEATE